VKLTLIALAIYLVVKIRNDVLRNPQDDRRREKPSMWKRAKVLAGLSLGCWMGTIAAGRFPPYTFTWLRVAYQAAS